MREIAPPTLSSNRIRVGPYASDDGYGMTGAFKLIGPKGAQLVVVSSGVDHESGWEHVSVSCENRCPNWPEMCFVKNLFWGEQECVVQFHPPKSEYVNCHPNCLHLWKPITMTVPVPPSLLVGPKSGEA